MTYTAQTKQPVNEQSLSEKEKKVPETITSVEISFYDHEIYYKQKLIARIVYDHEDFVTEPWVVTVNGVEVFRRSWWQKCFDDIAWHYKRGTLPVQQPETPAATTGNEIMCQIAQECEKHGFELLDDGIYCSDFKVGEVGYTLNNSQLNSMPKSQKTCNCNDSMTNSLHNCELRIANCELLWWFIRASSKDQQKVWSSSVADAVQGLLAVEVESVSCEDLLDSPFDELTTEEWEKLLESAPISESNEWIAA